jgi:parallel beta-helix repeat protein
MITRRLVLTCLCLAALAEPTAAASLVRSAAGANPAAIQAAVDQFRTDLGPLNANVAGSFGSGRREINWDGVPDNLAAPNALPANFFNVNSPRGVVFSTPGTGFEVSADASNATATPVRFGHIDPSYPNFFGTFSPERLFTARGSTITDVTFFVPGTSTPANVRGFGVVFTDVDVANTTSLQFFDLNGALLGTFFAPSIAGNQTLSFIGVSFNAGERVGRVRINSGNQVLAAGNVANESVVMDDFIYAEPQPHPVVNVNTAEAFVTIQAAIDDAQTLAGHVIQVAAGTFSELVTVNKAVELRGARFGVDGRDATRGTGESIVNGAVVGDGRSSGFRIATDGVTIDGFTIQDQTSVASFGAGIVMNPGMAGAKIRNNVLRNNVAGLFLSNDQPRALTIIERNLFSANNQPGAASGNGIYTDQFLSGGTLINVHIDNNTFAGNSTAAVLLGSTTAASQSRIVIANNTMSSNGNGVLLYNTVDSMVMRNTFTNSFGSQVVAGGRVTGVSITENVIENGAVRGIRIGDFGGGGPNTGITLNCNSIQGNAGAGLQLDAGGYNGSLDAAGNWWGSATGPTIASNPGGTGQTIVDPAAQVSFSGFLTARADQQPEALGYQCDPTAIIYAVDDSNNLLRFNSFAPATIVSSVPITGLNPAEIILGIDFRPSTGELFAVGSDERLYLIDPGTGAATLRAQLTADPGDVTSPFTTFLTSEAGVSFNPVPDVAGNISLRIVTGNDENLRINANTGRVTTDTNISGASSLRAVAYTDNDLDPASGTSLYAYDFTTDALFIGTNANAGTYTLIGAAGITSTGNPNLDIQALPGLRDVAFASLRVQPSASNPARLYNVNLSNGLCVPLGNIGSGLVSLRGMAVAPAGSLQFGAPSYLVSEQGPTANINVTRVGGTAGTVSVRLTTQDGTAGAADYTATDQIVTFVEGETSKIVFIPITNDSADEGNETINLVLSQPGGGALLGPVASATLTISGDDETTPTLSTATSGTTTPGSQFSASATIAGSNNAGGTITFNVYAAGDASCSAAPIFTSTVPVNGNGSYSSAPFTPTRTGNYIVVASYSGDANNLAVAGSCSDPAGAVTVKPATALANLATRLRVETGDNVLIGGFIITGTLPKTIIVRAIGPSLGIAGQLENPQLEIYDGGGNLVAANDNWQDAPNRQAIIDSTIPPSNDLEAAFLGTVAPGSYTAVVSGVNEGTGIGVVEAYDLDRSVDSKFANIATRGSVQSGDNVMIGGLIILGDSNQKVLVRAIGPSLGIEGSLANPTLELVDGDGTTLAANDNWRDTKEADIQATTIPPSNDLESAILATLAPAPYTAIVRGADGSSGVALVEVYGLQ